MKDNAPNQNDELRQHYDLKGLRVRKLGPGRESFAPTSGLKDAQSEIILRPLVKGYVP